jgi:hypothetical protein
MTVIIVEGDALYYKRRNSIKHLIAPLLPDISNTVVEQIGLNRDYYTVGPIPRGSNPSSFLNPEDPVVHTQIPNVFINYYEMWGASEAGNNYFLERAYMHFHYATRGEQKQILALHCDPAMHQDESHYRYKRGPHFHVEGGNPDLSRAHVSLCLSDDALGGSDLISLMTTFRDAVSMIRKEIFPCWERKIA